MFGFAANARDFELLTIELNAIIDFDSDGHVWLCQQPCEGLLRYLDAKPPDALSRAFVDDRAKQAQWASFMEAINGQAASLDQVIRELGAFTKLRTAM